MSKREKASPAASLVLSPQSRAIKFINTYKIPAFCIICTFVVYCSSVQNQFINWDDSTNVGAVKTWDFGAILTNRLLGNWTPVNLLLLTIQYKLFGLNPEGYHATSLLLHLCNVGLMYGVTLKLSGKPLTAGIVALLFGIQPMNVESVAWVSAQNQVLFAFFYLAAMFTYCKYKEPLKSAGLRKGYLALTVVFFICSAASKGLGVTLPLTLVLIDCYQADNWHWKFIAGRLVSKIPFLILSVGFGMMAFAARQDSGAMSIVVNHTFGQQMIFACYGLLVYIIKFFLPFWLSCYYMYPLKDVAGAYPFIFRISPVLVIVSAGTIAAILYKGKRKDVNNVLLFGLLFFMLNIILVLQIKPVGYLMLAERYTYLSYFGLYFIAAIALNGLWEKYRHNLSRIALGTFFCLYITALGIVTYTYSNVWKDSITLWTHVIDGFPPVVHLEYAAVAYVNRANAYGEQGQLDSVISDCNQAIAIDDNSATAYLNRGSAYQLQGKLAPALNDLNKSIILNSDLPLAYTNRGAIYGAQGKYEAALADFNKAITLDPAFSQAYANRAILFDLMGNHAGAESDRRKANESASAIK